MPTRLYPILLALAVTASILGCSAPPLSDNPTFPAMNNIRESGDSGSHWLWGIYDVQVIPDGARSAKVDFTPLRGVDTPLNVVGIMEGGGKPAVKVDPPVSLIDNVLIATIRLTHPYDNLKLTGFDVRGILIGHGSIGGFSDTLFYAGPTSMELLNPDGHTRLWNPTEYTGKGYVDGKLSKPDSIANYTATLNGYKYFADDLNLLNSVELMSNVHRGAFTAGSSNARYYRIHLGDKGLSFQYAIDANWSKPSEPVTVPDSFDVNKANCPEPYHIEGRVGPGIGSDGGSADISARVYDWQKDTDKIYVEAPLLTDDIIELTNPVDKGTYVEFSGTLTNEKSVFGDSVDVIFYARGTDPVSSKVYTEYRLYHLPTLHVPPDGVKVTIQDEIAYKTIGTVYTYGGTGYDWGNSDPAPIDFNDADGPWDFTKIPSDTTSEREALSKTNGEVVGFAGDFNSAVTQFFKTEWALTGSPTQIYQAEEEDIPGSNLWLWGIYELENLDGSIPFDPPLNFPYPLVETTHFSTGHKYTVIPFLLTFTIAFERWGLGDGIAFTPTEPGVNGWGWEAHPALLTRTIASAETGGAMGKGPLGKALIYEWISDDGTILGTIMTGNTPDNPPNYDEGTYQIISTGGAQSLIKIEKK
jgi:hypothetical protein